MFIGRKDGSYVHGSLKDAGIFDHAGSGMFKARTDVSRVLGCFKGAGMIKWYITV